MNNIFNLRNLFVVSAAMVLSSAVGASAAFASDVTRSFGTLTPAAGSDLPVSLTVTVTPPDDTPPNDTYIIDEVVPTGWTVTAATNGGDFTSQAGHVKWIVLDGAVSAVNQYTVTVPVDASGVDTFSGEFAFGSTPAPLSILGETSVDVQPAAPAPTPSLSGVNVTPAVATIDPGSTIQLAADVLDQNGAPFVGATVTWTSSDTAIADVDSTGLVIAGANDGVVTITASATDGVIEVTGTAEITVSTPVSGQVLTSVDITPATATIETGATVQLTANPLDQDGLPFAGATVTWVSDDLAVATVDTNGLVSAVSPGTVNIAAIVEDGLGGALIANAVITVTAVVPPPPAAPVLTSVTVAPASASIEVDATVQLSASPVDQDNVAFAATVTWTSSDDLVATVDTNGLVTGVSEGSATITASATDGAVTVTGTSAITVTAVVPPPPPPAEPVLTAVDVAPASASIEVDATVQLSASPLDENNLAFVGATVTWSSSDTAVATVDATGLVTGVSAGSATITASATDGAVTVTGTSAITVTAVVPPPPPPAEPVLTAVNVSPNVATVEVGATVQLDATALDQDDADFQGATIDWSSDNEAVATVDANGLVTGVSAGSATITATATDGAITVSDNSDITVTSTTPPPPPATPVLTSVDVAPASASIEVDATVQLSASPLDENNLAFATTVTWSSSDDLVATVDATGLVTGVSAGSATITASATDGAVTVTGTSAITVTAVVPPPPVAPTLTSVTVSPSISAMLAGASQQFSASSLDQNGASIAATVTWSSSDTAVATVDTNGLVTSVAAGTATITASATSGATTVTSASTISVLADTVSTVSRSFSATTLAAGSDLTVSLTVNVLSPNDVAPNDFYIIDEVVPAGWTVTAATNGGDFTSQAGHVKWVVTGGAVSVTHTYTATAPAAGIATFSGEFGFGPAVPTVILGATQATVQAAPVAPVLSSVSVSPGTVSVVTGGSQQFSASPRNQNGAGFTGATVTWSSSDTAVATVDASGLVTGVAAGTATVTASAVSGVSTVTGTAAVTVLSSSVSVVSRSFSATTLAAGSDLTVSLTVNVLSPNDVAPNDFYIIDEVVPAGWTVTAATNGGDFTSQAGHVKWVVTGGAVSVTHTYTATAPAAGIATFSGEFGFGPTVPLQILGSTVVTVVPPLSGNQQLPAADVTLSVAQPQVVIVSSYTSPTTISVPASVTNGSLDLSSLLVGSSATLPGSVTIQATTPAGIMIIEIPAGTTLTASSTWSGILNLPTATTTSAGPTPSAGNTITIGDSIEIGLGDTPLSFDNSVKITFVGQAGRRAGWAQGGVFHEITATCDALVNPTLAAGADCKIDSGADMLVWTKHFSTFITYTETPIPAPAPAASAGGGGGGGGGAISPIATANTTSSTVALSSTGSTPGSGQVLGAAVFLFGKNLTVGSRGEDVLALQRFLIGEGYAIPAGATGYFGAQTKSAVIAFQKKRGVLQTGFVGPLTRAELNRGSVVTAPSSSSGFKLTAAQADSILALLQSFGAEPSVVNNVKISLGR